MLKISEQSQPFFFRHFTWTQKKMQVNFEKRKILIFVEFLLQLEYVKIKTSPLANLIRTLFFAIIPIINFACIRKIIIKLSILLDKSGTRPFPHILSLHFIIYKRVISLVCYWFYSSQKRDLAVVRNYAIFRSWYQRQRTRWEMKYRQHGNGFVMSIYGKRG